MKSTLQPVWALFIGGPLHGTWCELPCVVSRYEHLLDDGGMVPYGARFTLALSPGKLAFAPVGMTDYLVAELAAQVPAAPPTADPISDGSLPTGGRALAPPTA